MIAMIAQMSDNVQLLDEGKDEQPNTQRDEVKEEKNKKAEGGQTETQDHFKKITRIMNDAQEKDKSIKATPKRK